MMTISTLPITRSFSIGLALSMVLSGGFVHLYAQSQQTEGTPLQTDGMLQQDQDPTSTLPRRQVQAQQSQDYSTDHVTFPRQDSEGTYDLGRSAMTEAQIDDLLQQRPELMVDLKTILSDQLQLRGTNILADSITDEQLLSQIAASVTLRASITNWLRARGYVSQVDLDRSSEDQTINPINNRMGQRIREQSFDPLAPDARLSQAGEPDSLRDFAVSEEGRNPGSGNNLKARQGIARPSANTEVPANKSEFDPKAKQNITDVPEVLRLPAPYNLRSMRDLYTQVPQDDAHLKRFGSEMFVERKARNSPENVIGRHDAPIDLPIGPDYVLGAGDSIVINLWGGISQSITRVVDREGKVSLPEAGSLVVAGLSLQRAQDVIASALKQQFRDAKVDVTIARLRTVRVYVVGDVQRPGAYDLTSLSTPLNALYAAGGPTAVGSLRVVRHYRGQQLVREDDLYDFLLHGLRVDDERLESGDTLLIPPVGPQVAVFGAVKRPAIYELKGDETLRAVLEDAGGATVAAALNHITVERIQANKERETVKLDQPPGSTEETILKSIAGFNVKDGDRIHIAPILPHSERAIYVEGHVTRPGRYSYQDGMKLNDVLKSYQDLLPEPAMGGEIVRLVPPDLHAETIQFDLAETLIGNSNPALQPFDTIRVHGRYEVDAPHVVIRGEVLRPGSYALSRGMTVVQLVKMSGGFKRDALLESADLTSYSIESGKKVVSQRSAVGIGAAFNGSDPNADVSLKPGDILTIHQISGWADIGASVSVKGEVAYPGSYGLQEGEHLSSVLRRAGLFRSTAYADGAILVRTQVKQLEDRSREELIRQIETTSASARIAPSLNGQDQTQFLQAAAQQQNEVLQRLRSQPASGRLVIHISLDIDSWANTPADIELRSGDVLTIPKRPGFVLVTGQVYNASAITFVPGKTAGWYLRHAGGTNDVANNGEIFIVKANGSVIGRHSGGLFSGSVLSTRLDAGDVIVVPQKIIGGSLVWRNLLTVAQIASSVAITAAVAGVI
jgi:protein involved in polysaccharide export with SLBB domain